MKDDLKQQFIQLTQRLEQDGATVLDDLTFEDTQIIADLYNAVNALLEVPSNVYDLFTTPADTGDTQ